MVEPVVAEDGHHYEHAAIARWLGSRRVSPRTNLPMGTTLHPSFAARQITARAVREVLQVSQASARRMALGRALEVRVEGAFGALTLKPGSLGAPAAWTSHPPRGEVRTLLDELGGETSREVVA